MGLYLCIFCDDLDVDGVDVGGYADFNSLRDYIVRELENGVAGSQYPTFVLHSDCDGEWSLSDCEKLKHEIPKIINAMQQGAAVSFVSDWQKALAKSIGLNSRNAFESFIDVDGEFLMERLHGLVGNALTRSLPISFQ